MLKLSSLVLLCALLAGCAADFGVGFGPTYPSYYDYGYSSGFFYTPYYYNGF